MQAFVYDTYGTVDVVRLAQLARPQVGAGQLLVEVHAAGVGRTDWHMLRAEPFFMRLVTGLRRPRQPVLGSAFAGVVTEVGSGVSVYAAGDRVFGFDDAGAGCFAQFALRPVDEKVARLPEGVAFDSAAGVIEGFHYALNFANKVRLERGTRVLVNGTGGAIGAAGLQLCKYFGAYVVAVCEPHQVELARRLGADRVIDIATGDFTQQSERFQHVFDMVGKSSYGRCRHLLEPGGVYVSTELGRRWANVWLALAGRLLGDKRVLSPFPVHVEESLRLAAEMLEAGKLDPVIERTYPFAELPDALRYVGTGRKTGNVVLSVC